MDSAGPFSCRSIFYNILGLFDHFIIASRHLAGLVAVHFDHFIINRLNHFDCVCVREGASGREGGRERGGERGNE